MVVNTPLEVGGGYGHCPNLYALLKRKSLKLGLKVIFVTRHIHIYTIDLVDEMFGLRWSKCGLESMIFF